MDLVGNEEGRDFHLLRQDAGGLWSQKRGSAPVNNLDAAGRPITNPLGADLDYSSIPPPFRGKCCPCRLPPCAVEMRHRCWAVGCLGLCCRALLALVPS